MSEPTMPEGFPPLTAPCMLCDTPSPISERTDGQLIYHCPNCQHVKVIDSIHETVYRLVQYAEAANEIASDNTERIDELCDPQEGPHSYIRRLDGDFHETYDGLTNRIADQDERIAALEAALVAAGITLAEREGDGN